MVINWLAQRLRRPGIQAIYLQPGKVYAFAYRADRREREKDELDHIPVFIPLLIRGSGMRGINILKLRDPLFRRRFIELYRQALVGGDTRQVARRLYDLYRLTQRDGRLAQANRFFSFSNIRGKVVELDDKDLDELITRIL